MKPFRHAPGLHQNVPEAIYRADPAISQSDLKLLMSHCPAKALAAKLEPSEQTPAQELGQIVHQAVLEPSLFEKEWVVRPNGMERRSNAGKAAWAAFEKEHAGKGIITQEQHDEALRIRNAVWAHPTASEILKNRKLTEVSAFWTDPETGLSLKGRMDCIGLFGADTAITDLKTTRDASARSFARDAANFGYHFQAACYLQGLDVLSPRERIFLVIAVEKTPPYLVAVYELDWASLDAGHREFRAALAIWKECSESGIWPGYPDTVQTLELPRWALGMVEEATF